MSFKLSTGNIAVPSASTTVTASDGDSVTIQITASCYLTDGYVYSTGVVAKFYVDNESSPRSTQTILGNQNNYTAPTKKTVTYKYTVNRAHAAKTSKWRVDFHQYTDKVDQGRKVYLNGSRTIAAQTSYTVKFNANGGTGAPAAQTKWYNDTLKLSSTKPSRTGYTFKGWSTSSTATSATYSAGGNYTANAAATLYAVWSANTYTITLDGNGGTSSTKSATYGSSITLPTLTRTGYTFLGWATTVDATSATYSGGASYTVSGNKTLYAVWKLAYWNPIISQVTAKRCISNGTLDDYGTYLYVTFNFECCTLTSSTNALSKVEFEWTGDSDVDQTITSTASYILDGTTTKGSFGAVIGGSLDPEVSCSLVTTITDTSGGSNTDTRKIGVPDWPIDFLGVGNGAAFGKVAELPQFLDVNYKLLVRDTSEVKGDTANTGAFIIGDIAGQHLAFDSNEVQAKTGPTTPGWYYLNKDGGSVWIGNSASTNKMPGMIESTYDNIAYTQTHPTTGTCVKFGVGSGGTNHGVWSDVHGSWILNSNGENIALWSPNGMYKPYYTAGDSVNVTLLLAGFCTSSKTQVHFTVPLCKPIYGISNVTVSSQTDGGLMIRQGGSYTHGSSASAYAKPSSYSSTYSPHGLINVVATYSTTTNAVNNDTCGVRAMITIKFNA